jgi:N-acyl-L-homoserine lactone synthetase
MSAVVAELPTSLIDRVERLLQRVDYRKAESPEERAAIFRLRYQAYLREGAIGPNLSGQFSDPVDDSDNVWLFGVHIDGKLAGSIRLSITIPGNIRIPALEVFSDVLLGDIVSGRRIVDPTRFVADREMSRQHPELPYVTLRLPWLALEYFQADCMLAAVRAEHQAFYKRMWGHRAVCAPRPYPNLQKPISLMTLDYHEARDRVHRRYPFFRSNYFERRMLFERNIDMAQRTAA